MFASDEQARAIVKSQLKERRFQGFHSVDVDKYGYHRGHRELDTWDEELVASGAVTAQQLLAAWDDGVVARRAGERCDCRTCVNKVGNLNFLRIDDESREGAALHDPSTTSGQVEAVFRDIRARLIAELGRWKCVVGCVAWLTDREILRALARLDVCQLIVQKEDFLRPDKGTKWDAELRELYSHLPSPPVRYAMPHPVSGLSVCGDPSIEAVRCVGIHNADRAAGASPRAHHKFIVFCDPPRQDGDAWIWPMARAVWTGSYNFTWNAEQSLENALIVHDEKIASAYLQEWAQICAVSEPLNWDLSWCAPEWRIGT